MVAGGAGFIGSHLCDYLLNQGWRVVCIDNLLTGRKENIAHLDRNPAFKFIECDVANPTIFRITRSLKVNLIFNLASPASPKDYLAMPIETLIAGADGTRNLLDLALRKGATFIQASTSEVYGNPEEHPQSESYWGNVNPVGERSVYDEAKRYGEALVIAYHRSFKLPVRIARIFNTYGPRMKLNDGRLVPTLIYQALTGRPLTIFGTGRQTRSFCYISDMITGLYRLINCPDPFPINLGNPEEFTVLGFARLIKKLTDSKSPLVFHPLPSDDPERRRPDIRRARKLLDWQPTIKLEEGLRLTIDWFRQNGLN
ncbi:MAG: UDP-glucuronic acid decarboxylase family protein [bacterium]